MINRRGLITGLISFVAAPAIVRASSLMPVKGIDVVYGTWFRGRWFASLADFENLYYYDRNDFSWKEKGVRSNYIGTRYWYEGDKLIMKHIGIEDLYANYS